jgi:multiple sugar transport system permease protein
VRPKGSARYLLSALGAAITAIYLFPIYWMYASSLKSPVELFASPPTLFPRELWFGAYAWIFTRENVPLYLMNSFLLAGSATFFTIVLAVPAAYAMSRLRSAWVDGALILVMLSQVLPPALMATPVFIFFRQLELVGTYHGIILALVTKSLPFAIVVLRTTFLQVPHDLEEAARVDGCTKLSAIFRVILPVAQSGIVVAATLVFMMVYGEYVYAASLLPRRTMQPATVGLYSFIGAEISDWNNIMAFAAVFVTPVIALFILMQRLIVQGLTSGALKG